MPAQAQTGAAPAMETSSTVSTIAGSVRDRVASVRDRHGAAQAQGDLLRHALTEEYQLERTDDETRIEAAITGTFNAVVAAAVTLIVGLYVFSQISSTMPTPENTELANATDTVKSTTGDAFTLGAVAVIVLVASLILSMIGGGFGGSGGRRR